MEHAISSRKAVRKRNGVKIPVPRRVFLIVNGTLLTLFALICLAPFFNLLAISLSSSEAVDAGIVGLIPVEPSLSAYKLLLEKSEFFVAFGKSVVRLILGTAISLVVVTLCAYPMSRNTGRFRGRKVYLTLFIVMMFFNGGLIPTYILIGQLNLYDTVWALVLPAAMNAWNVVLLVNFFRQIPQEMIEATMIDGAGHYRILFSIVLPVSLPALATVTLFTAVLHWNAWFDGIIYRNPENFPLQSYIYNMINEIKMLTTSLDPGNHNAIATIPGKTLRSAQIFLAMIPIMLVYPFMQKFFIKGLVMGSVKG